MRFGAEFSIAEFGGYVQASKRLFNLIKFNNNSFLDVTIELRIFAGSVFC